MIRMSTAVMDAEIIRLYRDGVEVKLIVQVLGLKNRWRVERALIRERRANARERLCPDCPYAKKFVDGE